VDRMKLDQQYCSTCRRAPEQADGLLGSRFDPLAPQFTEDAAHLTEYKNQYAIQHGVHWTSILEWRGLVYETQTWSSRRTWPI
jgi:hypothetical protein